MLLHEPQTASKKEPAPDLQGKKVAVLTYTHKKGGKATYLAGPSQDLKRYLVERAGTLFFMEQPNSISENLAPTAELYQNGKLMRTFRFPFTLPKKMCRPDIDYNLFAYVLLKFRDVISTLYFFARVPTKTDCVVAVESVNALLALLWRLVGRTRRVIYDVIDYSPVRFPNRALNRFFHFLDRICVKRCDLSWVQSPLIIEERGRRGLPVEKQIVKPTGVDSAKLLALPFEQIAQNQIIYVGGIYAVDGVEVLIEALPQVREKVPQVQMLVIGYGNRFQAVRNRTRELGLDGNVTFLGAVTDAEKVDELIRQSAVGLAPYRLDPNSVKAYNDTAKPKLYLSFGTPVVMTRINLFSQELEREKAGFAVEFAPQAWAEALLRLLGDPQTLRQYRDNALRLAGEYRWENIFDRLFAQMGKEK